MQCKNNNGDLVSDFLISVVSFEQGTKLCFTSEQEKSLNPVTTTTKKHLKKTNGVFFYLSKKKISGKCFLLMSNFFQ